MLVLAGKVVLVVVALGNGGACSGRNGGVLSSAGVQLVCENGHSNGQYHRKHSQTFDDLMRSSTVLLMCFSAYWLAECILCCMDVEVRDCRGQMSRAVMRCDIFNDTTELFWHST